MPEESTGYIRRSFTPFRMTAFQSALPKINLHMQTKRAMGRDHRSLPMAPIKLKVKRRLFSRLKVVATVLPKAAFGPFGANGLLFTKALGAQPSCINAEGH